MEGSLEAQFKIGFGKESYVFTPKNQISRYGHSNDVNRYYS